MKNRHALLGAVSLAGLALAAAPSAFAQSAPVDDVSPPQVGEPSDPSGDSALLDEVVVTGTRVGRSRLDTLSPVDVFHSGDLQEQASTELAEALASVAPSITFPRPSATDGTDVIRPAALRGLSPDQTLVLVNGARRHTSALVNVNGSIGRGSAAVDLNAIPTAAVERVEILREGASAQYGSDAIAGVINLRLREAREGGAITTTLGQYFTEVEAARGSRDEQDGRTVTVSGWAGLPLGPEGFLTVSAEVRDREPTSRGDLDPRVAPTRVTSRYGDPQARDYTVYLNAGLPLENGVEAYGWAGYQNRDAEAAAFFRIPSNSNNVPAIYPDGFLPLIGADVQDFTAAAGLRGEVGGWQTDLNLVFGRNEIDYRVSNTLNPTYGAQSPTAFEAGGFAYHQLVLGLDLTRGFEVGFAGPLNVSAGLEARREGYQIRAGEPASYARGSINPAATPGAQGFPGLQPSNEVDEDRSALGAYVDLEADVTDHLSGSLAVRTENYSDFGSTTTGRAAARYKVTPALAVRGSVSTGFRAPSLQQSFYTATSTNFINGVPFETGTFPATSAVSQALGAQQLEPEKSLNYGLGLVFNRGPFELTADAYRIDVDNRIVLSDNLGGRADILALLQPFGITQARFFTNGVDTRTEGLDIVARYRVSTDRLGRFDFTGAASFSDTEITRLPSTNTLSALTPPPVLFGRVSQNIIQSGTPNKKLVAAVDWGRDMFGLTARVTHYGEAVEPGTTAAADIRTGEKTLVDLEARYDLGRGINLALGVDNLFDVYPDITPAALNSTGALAFTRYSPFGFNGRFAYVRVGYQW